MPLWKDNPPPARPALPVPHEHEWLATAVTYPKTLLHPRVDVHERTYVLLICTGCRLPDSRTLDGSWTIDQVRGEIDATETQATGAESPAPANPRSAGQAKD
jgi:hypothetical protein